MIEETQLPWWTEEYGYFGTFYLRADTARGGADSLRLRTVREVDGILRLLHLSPGATILDCPCGYGRHCIELASRGYSVTGLDLNSAHLARARTDAGILGVTLRRENMLFLNHGPEFDAVISMFASFGFFATKTEDLKVLSNYCAALKPGGRLLLHTDVTVSQLEPDTEYVAQQDLDSGQTLRIVEKYNSTTSRLDGRWTIADALSEESREYSVRLYRDGELVEMCQQAGFSVASVYGDWMGTAYSEESQDIIVVATR